MTEHTPDRPPKTPGQTRNEKARRVAGLLRIGVIVGGGAILAAVSLLGDPVHMNGLLTGLGAMVIGAGLWALGRRR